MCVYVFQGHSVPVGGPSKQKADVLRLPLRVKEEENKKKVGTSSFFSLSVIPKVDTQKTKDDEKKKIKIQIKQTILSVFVVSSDRPPPPPMSHRKKKKKGIIFTI